MLNSSLFFIETVLQLFLLPASVTAVFVAALRLNHRKLSSIQIAALHIVVLPTFWTVYLHLSRWHVRRQARQLGVKLPHTISGKRLGNLDLLPRLLGGLLRGYIGDIVDEILDEEGVDTLQVALLWSDFIFTRDPEVVKFVLSTGFQNFGKGPRAKILGEGFLLPGIFAVDNPLAKYHRGILRPYFARERISDFKHFHHYTEKMLTLLHSVSRTGEGCDLQEVFERFTLDAAGAFLFGSPDLNTLDLPLTKAGQKRANLGLYTGFAKGFEDSKSVLETRRTGNIYSWTATQFIYNPMDKPAKLISDYIEPLIKQAAERRSIRCDAANEDLPTDESECFLDHLISSMGNDTTGIKTQLVNVMLAARDTTAILLSFVVYFLSLHPEVMDKLRAEILGAYSFNGIPTFDDMKELRYLRAVINETLRLYPPVPLNNRTSLRPCTVPTLDSRQGPFYVPKNVRVIYSTISFQKRGAFWGDDAEAFNPERWLDPVRARKIASEPFNFVPFNAGPRICVGQQFAYNQASFVLVRLLQKFDRFTLVQDQSTSVDNLPPPAWKGAKGRKGVERIWPQSSVTLFSKVRSKF